MDPDERSSSTSLDAEDEIPLLRWYRDGSQRASRAHAYLELAWYIGARQGALRALDLRDFSPEERYVDFRHRPETGAPLKNKRSGERPVGIPEAVVAERVDATIETIREHYEAASPREQMERRRRQYVNQLDIDDDPNTDD